uniref:Reverse transcriptase Ty1/copia-type domain-containing protein n=1 Tax=Cajanus cajan TaxID=3821 RepID=A0A151RAU3_CAJCA|nr:hypothetical protein KK1_039185 [Cajanus cajan]
MKDTLKGLVVILNYVDDLIVGGTDSEEIAGVKIFLDQKFNIKDLGNLSFFLGLEVTRTKKGINLC